jgi:hypothetical protein
MAVNTGRGLWALPQNVNVVNGSLGACLHRLQTGGGENVNVVNECKHVYKSESDELGARVPINKDSPLTPSLRESESGESSPESGPPPEPELFEPPPDIPPGYGLRYDYLYSGLINRGLSHDEADRQVLEQINMEYRNQAAAPESELDIW